MEFQACKESELERADTPAMGQVTFVPRVQEAVWLLAAKEFVRSMAALVMWATGRTQLTIPSNIPTQHVL